VALQKNLNVYGGLSGGGNLQVSGSRWQHLDAWLLAGSSSYTGAKSTVEQGILSLLNGGTAASAKPLGSAAVTVNPGGVLRSGCEEPGRSAEREQRHRVTWLSLGLAYNPARVPVIPAPSTRTADASPGVLGIDVVRLLQSAGHVRRSPPAGPAFLGSSQGGTYVGATLTAGAGGVYRLGDRRQRLDHQRAGVDGFKQRPDRGRDQHRARAEV
jgi:hypothetical protein